MQLGKELFESELERARRVFESRSIRGSTLTDDIKEDAARLHARLDRIPIPPNNREAGRLVALAKTALEEAVMWGVKAISRGEEAPTPSTGETTKP